MTVHYTGHGVTLHHGAGDYPWQGPKTAQYAQVGNAIPPLLAAHIIAALDGAP